LFLAAGKAFCASRTGEESAGIVFFVRATRVVLSGEAIVAAPGLARYRGFPDDARRITRMVCRGVMKRAISIPQACVARGVSVSLPS
jgi:hypothetical protein